jgi:hypothetical protein
VYTGVAFPDRLAMLRYPTRPSLLSSSASKSASFRQQFPIHLASSPGTLLCASRASSGRCTCLGSLLWQYWPPLSISIVILNLVNHYLGPAMFTQKASLDQSSQLADAAVLGIDLVKSYNIYDQETWQYPQAILRAARQDLR